MDILVICEPKLTFREMSQLRRRFWERFGYQKLDLVCFAPGDRDPFKELILLDAIRL